ncbi:iron chelate uptake ABC transporter family permease subunit [Labrenzia sp. DG1229]|uniref:FecCD family ABC transporter permease n=1 Tax=Labrenzia sp. DG1229 TaxID=681847 RepID=UPI003369C422
MSDGTLLTSEALSLVRAYKRRSMRRVTLVILAFFCLAVLVVIDVNTGPADLTIWRTIEVIFDRASATPKEDVIIWQLRLPVAIMAVAVGAMLGVAGAEMQTILNNPLADPFTLGLSSAAGFGAALAIVFGWSVIPGVGGLFVSVNAFVFAMITVLRLVPVYQIARRHSGSHDPCRNRNAVHFQRVAGLSAIRRFGKFNSRS